MKNIIDFINSYSEEPEAKMIYFNIFNILSSNKKNENYTVNNNGIHFILNNIPESVLNNVNNYISNFKNMEMETKEFETNRELLLTSFNNKADYSKGDCIDINSEDFQETSSNWDEACSEINDDDCESLFGDEF
jgi:hypothetical protein